jgi:hypothetical protein
LRLAYLVLPALVVAALGCLAAGQALQQRTGGGADREKA